MTNQRFSDYVTSGAFDLKLTRRQIERLEQLARDPQPFLGWDTTAHSLRRKGLVEEIAAPSPQNEEGRQARLSGAGLLAVAMLAEAGLIPAELRDVAAREHERTLEELERRRRQECEARQRAQSAIARMEEAQIAHENYKRFTEGRKAIIPLSHKDPRPDISNEDLKTWAWRAGAAFGFEDEPA